MDEDLPDGAANRAELSNPNFQPIKPLHTALIDANPESNCKKAWLGRGLHTPETQLPFGLSDRPCRFGREIRRRIFHGNKCVGEKSRNRDLKSCGLEGAHRVSDRMIGYRNVG